MNPNVVVDAPIVSGTVLAERAVALGDHLRVDFLIALAHRLILVYIVESDHCRCVPMVIVAFLDNCLTMGRLECFYNIFGVNAAASHCLAAYLLQRLEQPAGPLGTVGVFVLVRPGDYFSFVLGRLLSPLILA